METKTPEAATNEVPANGPAKTVRFSENPDAEPKVEIKEIDPRTETETEGPTVIKDCKICDLCEGGWRPRVAINVPTPVNNFLSRQAVLNWLNDILEAELNAIEELGTGVVYCVLWEMLFPGCIPFVQINFRPTLVREYMQNFRILQTGFKKMRVNKVIPVIKLVQCKLQDNLDFVFWFKLFFETNYKGRMFCDLANCKGFTANKGPWP